MLDSTLIAAFVASATTLLGFFINGFLSRRKGIRQELKTSYGEIIAYARSIRRTLIAFHEFDISFREMITIINDQFQETTTELEIQKQAAFNYEEKAHQYRDILTTQQGNLDRAFFTIAGLERNYIVRRWKNIAKDRDDKKLQASIEKILSYKESPATITEAKDTVDKYFSQPLTNIQKICTIRMKRL